eukprot:TRINITY_DN28235_c0_g1_i1.p1 TRINITY_DN28235_c0_g1~~TRINITY_DN28235_c0_g1_i1.p1  ORF type:complete len:105 (-),score=2.40 TRINITY_DN28235_c0_g1_i1:90-404(-)
MGLEAPWALNEHWAPGRSSEQPGIPCNASANSCNSSHQAPAILPQTSRAMGSTGWTLSSRSIGSSRENVELPLHIRIMNHLTLLPTCWHGVLDGDRQDLSLIHI